MRLLALALGSSVVAAGIAALIGRDAEAPPASPAGRETRRASKAEPSGAVGALADLPARLRLALDDPALAPPLPEPGPTDWLSAHPEDGQTFGQFRTARRRAVTDERRTIVLLALEKWSPSAPWPSTDALAAYASAFFGLPARVRGPPADAPAFTTRTNPGTRREQVLTTDVLRWLPEELASDAYAVLALTERDLYPDPSWNFVFGQATLLDGVGVFSFARYDPDFPRPPRGGDPDRRVLRRCLKVMSHELGHMFGMEHCVHHHCLMNGSNHLAEMDAAPLHLCRVCLRKLQHAAGFDPLARAKALADSYRSMGLDDEARWSEERARFVEGP